MSAMLSITNPGGNASQQDHSCDLCITYMKNHPLGLQPCPLLDLSSVPSHRLALHLNTCHEAMLTYNPSEYVSLCCDSQGHIGASSSISGSFLFSPPAPVDYMHKASDPFIASYYEKRLCQKLARARNNQWLPPMEDMTVKGEEYKRGESIISGLGCNNNRTLRFLAMDSRISNMFAEKLGVKVVSSVGQIARYNTTAVIVDSQVIDYFSLPLYL